MGKHVKYCWPKDLYERHSSTSLAVILFTQTKKIIFLAVNIFSLKQPYLQHIGLALKYISTPKDQGNEVEYLK